ncbi:SSI family serine proteinase inhibitor [Nocardia mexicana]|uniref:Subtilisin inhibitor-like n=1 Tax=Nocardia mexicana TaxID=279262 RepID=A0A370GUM0_9NOCA|nr:SSI family serine proteinase inhibitor [Nocardia mexicana]RDI46254.1 subtilisin inhibitor-like [Nocardia mexicana]
MTTTIARVLAGATAAAAVILVPGAAAAEDTSTRLVLTREDSDQPTRTADLACDPVGGSHPDPVAACEYLLTGDLALPEEDPGVRCFRYHPVTLRAEGTFHGAPVFVERTYNCLVPDLPTPWKF